MGETLFFIKHVLIAYICIMGIVALIYREALILDSHIGEAVGVSLTYGVDYVCSNECYFFNYLFLKYLQVFRF